MKSSAYVLIFDINKFKQINDTYGHAEGDRALELVARQIYKVYGKYGACYRIGGDEFMIIALEGIDRFDDRLTQLWTLLRQEGQPYQIVLSCGRAGFLSDHSQDIWAIYRLADDRMYAHKQQIKQQMN